MKFRRLTMVLAVVLGLAASLVLTETEFAGAQTPVTRTPVGTPVTRTPVTTPVGTPVTRTPVATPTGVGGAVQATATPTRAASPTAAPTPAQPPRTGGGGTASSSSALSWLVGASLLAIALAGAVYALRRRQV